MTKNYNAEWAEQAAAPSNPSSTNWKVYFKSDGLYVLEDDGTEHGPFNVTDVNTHAPTHIDGGSDAVDGDKLEITWTPTNYTRDGTTPSETDSDDDLTAHLQGIDVGLAIAGTNPGAIFLSVSDGWVTTTAPCATPVKVEYGTNDVDLWLADFDQTNIEYMQWTVWMPDNWNGGTVTFKVVWTATAGTLTNTVEWNLQGISYADDDAIDATWGSAVEVSDALIALDDLHYSTESAAVTIAGTPAAGEMVQFRAWRDGANDTLDADARLIGYKVYYTKE